MPNYKVKIDVSKLDKSAFFHGKNGAIYCDLVIWENRDGEDNYGNTHSVKQDFGKDKGPERPPYVGNMKPFGRGAGRDRTPQDGYRKKEPYTPPTAPADDDSDSIPF